MKIILYVACIVMPFISLNVVATGNCTKQEVMKMIDKGFSKSDIDSVCNETAKCCCRKETYHMEGFITEKKVSDDVSYVWMDADSCTGTERPGGPLWNEYIDYVCTSQSLCGR